MTAYDPRTTAARPDLAAASLIGRVEAARFAEGRRRQVRDPVLDLRRAPHHDSPLDTQALQGERVTLYEEHEGWAWVQLEGDHYVGYVSADGLAKPGEPATHRVAVPRTFIYRQPTIKAAAPLPVSQGAQLAIVDIAGGFAAVAGGGFVWATHLAPIIVRAADFVAVAEAFLHVPYMWGGKTSSGLDCSGLVQVSLAAAGIKAPRDSDMQERALGRALRFDVTLEGLQPGDLVFWKGHVGIMRDALTLLHASGHHMLVASESLSAARDRIGSNGGGPITSIRRLAPSGEH